MYCGLGSTEHASKLFDETWERIINLWNRIGALILCRSCYIGIKRVDSWLYP